MERIPEKAGRQLFGDDPRAYDVVRPPYPEAVFSLLKDTGALYPGARTLEIGAGSGLATRRLLELGANPLVAIEPDARFHGMLALPNVTVLPAGFEETHLHRGSFDLVAVATAFHWLDAGSRVVRIADALEPGGSVALFWNVFQDPTRPDRFHVATRELLGSLEVSPSATPDGLPFALDRPAREHEFLSSGRFACTAYQETHWSIVLSAPQIRALYGGFSSLARLPAEQRSIILDRLAEIAESRFGGRVTRNMTSVAYLFRRA